MHDERLSVPRTQHGREAVAYVRGALLALVSPGPDVERFMEQLARRVVQAEIEAAAEAQRQPTEVR